MDFWDFFFLMGLGLQMPAPIEKQEEDDPKTDLLAPMCTRPSGGTPQNQAEAMCLRCIPWMFLWGCVFMMLVLTIAGLMIEERDDQLSCEAP